MQCSHSTIHIHINIPSENMQILGWNSTCPAMKLDEAHSCTILRVFIDSHNTMQCQCVIKFIIDGLHPMILFENKNHAFINQNLLNVTSRMTISYTKPCVFLGSGFLESHRRLYTLSYTFWTFIVGVYEPLTWSFT